MAFQNQKESILKFYDDTNKTIDQNKETYGKLVTKLNEKVGLTQTLTNNLDDFMEYSFPNFNKFRTDIQSQSLDDSLITYVYDINKDEYLTNFTLPNKKIVVKQNFNCVLMGDAKDCIRLNDGKPWSNLTNNIKTTDSFTSRTYLPNNKYIIENNVSNTLIKQCGCNNYTCSCGSNSQYQQRIYKFLNNSILYKPKETKNLEIWIDDYFNIYIPNLKTYMVYNYSKFPLYTFYTNLDKLNLYHNHIQDSVRSLMFNENCPEDLEKFNRVKSFVDSNSDYQTSQDKRNHYKTLFPELLQFYQYSDKQKDFSQFQSLSEKLEQLAPSDFTNIIVDGDTMNDEKKIFSQSQRIRELEVNNKKQLEEIEYLRLERTTFIENNNNLNDSLSDYQILLEELNSQLHDEIDKTSIQQKEVIKLKTINLECNEIKRQFRKQEDITTSIQSKLNDYEDKLSQLKTLNNSLIDKQMEAQQKLILERQSSNKYRECNTQLKLEIENYNIKISKLESEIESEKEKHKLSKTKIDTFISDMNKTKQIEIDEQYQTILISQLKEKNDEINQIQILNSKLNIEIKESKSQFELLKSKVSSLFDK